MNTITNSIILFNTLIYHLIQTNIIDVNTTYCYNGSMALSYEYLAKRLFTTFVHINTYHLIANMVSMYTLGIYEKKIGSANLLKLVIILSLMTTVIEEVIMRTLNLDMKCVIGFSGVLLGLQVYSYKYDKISIINGKSMDKLTAIIINLVLLHLSEPNASIIGHGVGLLSGFLLLKLL